MMKYNNPQDMVLVGKKTPHAVIYKSESHKLHQAFPVAFTEDETPEIIIQGQPVKLNEDGTIAPYTGEGLYLGIAMTDSIFPAYPGMEVTVAVEAFALIYARAAASLNAGYVTPGTPAEHDFYVPYSQSDSETNFICLNQADENELIQVLIK